MCASIDPPLFLVLNKDPSDIRRLPRNSLEPSRSPDKHKLAFAFVFLSSTSYFSVRKVFAFMDLHDAEGRMPFLVVLTNSENCLTI
jgi:hypothetical protein